MVMAILAIILTLILVIGIHELGHALAARIFHVRISSISIGFGKPLIQWKTSSGCDWSWRMWPFGGYVQLLNSRATEVKPKDFPSCFDKKPIWNRVIILCAGAFANMITAWIAFVVVFYIGIESKIPQIQTVKSDSVAAHAGIEMGDRFTSIEGFSISSWQDVGMQLIIYWGNPQVKIQVAKTTLQPRDLILDLSQVKFGVKGGNLLTSLGISPDLKSPKITIKCPSLKEAIHQTNKTILHFICFFIMVFKQLLTGVIPFSMLLGPLGIFTASVTSLSQGSVVFLFFIATLSLAVALVNLFPFPGLDGGHIVFAVIEKIRKKPISIAWEVLLHRLMIIVFCVLLVQLLMNDLQRYFAG
ncbi:M50 family metallopeptidase [Legionella waltersii]|uniref:Membrane associated zinc metalloprotease n=1 Tax=Legionella waltersii TaxID=66969 RepID=A0A0W1AGN9_9GAMM|nr:site-2 protease family protein [Legionella waltersii]KTD80497.1 membrane associated zinc metalloprotease [Legionella waltersii]SNV09651.1 membrane associated zinc metalloprotease [Legionella waltersii]